MSEGTPPSGGHRPDDPADEATVAFGPAIDLTAPRPAAGAPSPPPAPPGPRVDAGAAGAPGAPGAAGAAGAPARPAGASTPWPARPVTPVGPLAGGPAPGPPTSPPTSPSAGPAPGPPPPAPPPPTATPPATTPPGPRRGSANALTVVAVGGVVVLVVVVVLMAVVLGFGGDDPDEVATSDTTTTSTTEAAPTSTSTTTSTTTTTTAPPATTAPPTTAPPATAPPAASTIPARTGSDLPAGLLCRDLLGDGVGYEDAVAYWLQQGRPPQMDEDRDGVPCETVYPAVAVEAVWGPQGTEDGGVQPGLFCRDLPGHGLDYEAAVAYWFQEGQPARMDDDGNGRPCETVYPDEEVAAFWG